MAIDTPAPTPTPADSPVDVQLKLMRVVAAQRARTGSDLNQAQVFPEFDPTTKSYLYETAPTALKQLFGSPLAQTGNFAQGPNGERLVSSGWGDPLPASEGRRGSTSYNRALEYTSTLGETVLAAADGIIQFVGVQTTSGAVAVPNVHANESNQTVLDAKGNVVASTTLNNVGFGGIFVTILHNGDFQGYSTEYYRLTSVDVAVGQKVVQGQAIGVVGGAGSATGWAKQDFVLRFQIVIASGSLRAAVNPTPLVPNKWPGHSDSTNVNSATTVIIPILGPVGSQMAIGRAANLVIAFNRNTALENKGVAGTKADMSAHADRTAQTTAVESSAMQAASNAFQGKGTQVQNPMAFNFTTGLWEPDGKPI